MLNTARSCILDLSKKLQFRKSRINTNSLQFNLNQNQIRFFSTRKMVEIKSASTASTEHNSNRNNIDSSTKSNKVWLEVDETKFKDLFHDDTAGLKSLEA